MKNEKKVSVLEKNLYFVFFFFFFYSDIYIFFFIKLSFIYRESWGSCLLHLYELFFNFDVFSTFILDILSFKVDFRYLDEQILIAVVRKTSKIELLCFLGILSCKL